MKKPAIEQEPEIPETADEILEGLERSMRVEYALILAAAKYMTPAEKEHLRELAGQETGLMTNEARIMAVPYLHRIEDGEVRKIFDQMRGKVLSHGEYLN